MTTEMNLPVESKPKKKTSAKRLIIISIVTLIIGTLLFVPYHGVYKDGGTQEWRALGYVVVKWHRIYMEGTPEKEWRALGYVVVKWHRIYMEGTPENPIYKHRNDLRVYIFPLSLLDNGTLYKMEYGE